MTNAADDLDLEALFDEVASQRTPTVESSAPAAKADDSVTPPVAESAATQTELATSAESSQTSDADKGMYERLGGIVRTLHNSLRELGYDRSLSDVATQISDAQGRLEHVAALTEQAANKVLNTVDTCIPEQEKLGTHAKDIESRWAKLFEGKLSVEEFKTLAGDSRQFASLVSQATDSEKARLLEIMMAQDFQDITGQLIKKIVTITNTVERELAQLLRDNAPPEVKAAIAAAEQQQTTELMNGPAAPGMAMAQDDVDSLLADLGF